MGLETRKPFIGTLRVNESRPAELGQQLEASLAWGGVTLTAKRRQRVPRPCDRASKAFRGSPRSCQPRGPRRHAAMAWRARSRRGRRTGPRHMRGPWEPGRPVRLHRHVRLGNRTINSPEPTIARRRSLGANPRRKGWYRQAKATKCGETDG